jgi:hypothetical protein
MRNIKLMSFTVSGNCAARAAKIDKKKAIETPKTLARTLFQGADDAPLSRLEWGS